MVRIEEIAKRFVEEYGLTFERVRRFANEWAQEKSKGLSPPFYGNAHDWEEIGLFIDPMMSFCEKLSPSDKAQLRLSGHVIAINMTGSIIDLDRYLMYRALAQIVWRMVEKSGNG